MATERTVQRGQLLHIKRHRPSTLCASHRDLLLYACLLDHEHERRTGEAGRANYSREGVLTPCET